MRYHPTPSRPEAVRRARHMRLALALALVLVAFALAVAVGPGWAASSCLVSREAYGKIKPGMPAGEVAALVGCDPRRTHTFEAPEDPPAELTWDSERGYGPLTVLIQHGKVKSADQPVIY